MTPRFVDDKKLCERFGLSRETLKCLRLQKSFPQKDTLIHKTDSKAVAFWFDTRAGLHSLQVVNGNFDGEENFDE